MSERSIEREKPRVAVNKASWRVLAVAGLVIVLSLVAALVAQTSLTGEDGSSGEPLTTLTLVLAILAFLIQIFVFVFQSNATNNSVLRSEDLNAQTRGVLDKIEANSSATQKVLFAQFDRLLDYVVDGKSSIAKKPRSRSSPDPHVEDGPEQKETDDTRPVSKADLAQVVGHAIATATERPTFPVGEPESSEEDAQMLRYLRSWPTREEALDAVDVLRCLSALGLATLVRFGSAEVVQRLEGEWVGLQMRNPDTDPATEELLNKGLVRHFDGHLRLTDEGRAAWRVLPFLKAVRSPDWLDEILKPLLEPISGPSQADSMA